MSYNIKYCESCMCNIQECLHLHHTASKGQRRVGKKGEEVMLCANCHEIIHSWLGGKNLSMPKVLTKQGTISTIIHFLKKHSDKGLPYWFYSMKDIQRQIENDVFIHNGLVDNKLDKS